ncbi:MAG: HIT domain-containing protein [Pseudomonadales bacterium]|nr:HIT domain-containing protein [Pseudomonadales bacterium]
MAQCIFCQIVNKEMPASIVYEDDLCLVFMDIFPIKLGHTLIIPKTHSAFLHELDDKVRQHLFKVANAVLQAQRDAGITRDGANLLVNDGKAANQHVPHVHVHVLPRDQGDLVKVAWTFLTRMLNFFGKDKKRAKLDKMASDIRQHLPSDI